MSDPAVLVATAADSLWVRIPYYDQNLAIPSAALWQFASSLASGLVIAFAVYRLARSQFRSNRWWERREAAYTAVVKQLVRITDARSKLAEHENALQVYTGRSQYSETDLASFSTELREAEKEVRKEIERGRFLLSGRAIGAVEAYFRSIEAIGSGDFNYPEDPSAGASNRSYQKFFEFAQLDLGESVLRVRFRRSRRWIRFHIWYPSTRRWQQYQFRRRAKRRDKARRSGGGK